MSDDVSASEMGFWLIAAILTGLTTLFLLHSLHPMDRSTRRLAAGLMVCVPLSALGLYALLGRPDLTAWHTRPSLPPVISGAVARLTQDTIDHPGDAQAWVLLGDVDRKIQHYDQAESAYRHALALQPGDAGLNVAIGETMLAENGGSVTPPIAALFQVAPANPISRYYLALAKSQAADWAGALRDWQKLKSELPADSPLQPLVNARIDQARRVLGMMEDH